jgi:hypothetical protein
MIDSNTVKQTDDTATKARKTANRAIQKLAQSQDAVSYLRDATGGYTISKDKQDYRDLVLSLVPPELADAFNTHLKERAEFEARQKSEYEARRAEEEKRERERAEYRRQHPEKFVFITILKDRYKDRYCNSPIVFITRTGAEMDTILNAWAAEQLEDDEDKQDEQDDPVERYFYSGDDRRYEMVLSEWAEFDDPKEWEKDETEDAA